jgi:PAS domain S-box-containing protein
VARGHSTVVDTASDKSGSTAPINILMVDDTPAKLLTYEVVLHELGENLIKASSVEEALRTLLKVDVALILTDVSMPIVDGFDFAKIVREHPQFRTIPIIFVSAIAHSDLDRLRAYASGAVDYVTVPIAPELLRAKVKVFVDLYRNRRELETLKSELEDRVGKRTAQLEAYTQRLAESEQRYRSLIENANDIVATLDLNLVFTAVNPAVRHILGYTPQEMVGTSLTQYVPQNQVAMHAGMLQRKLGGEASARYELELASKDRQRYITLEVSSTLLFDSSGNPVGIHAIARDISERKEAEARQLVLIRELQHRTKNLLAVIQSIVSNTLTRSRDLVSGVGFKNRLLFNVRDTSFQLQPILMSAIEISTANSKPRSPNEIRGLPFSVSVIRLLPKPSSEGGFTAAFIKPNAPSCCAFAVKPDTFCFGTISREILRKGHFDRRH